MDYEYLKNFIDKRNVTLISMVDEEGYPNTKAMLVPRRIEDNVFFFTTNTSSQSIKIYEKNSKACIYFFEKGRFNYEGIMLIGNMEICYDYETKLSIWRDGDTLFYKNGVEDPDYCVLKFTAIKGRQYKNFKKKSFEL